MKQKSTGISSAPRHVDAVFICVLLISFVFSAWLMFHTFSYDGSAHEIKIAFKLWSDFGAHIPLIRSFSMGDNLTRFVTGKPVQYPVFAGPVIRYHFLFDMFAGILEKAGLRIDWALNIPSIAGFFGLLVLIYLLARDIFRSRLTGLLSVIFFLFNGSLSFLRFFTMHPFSVFTPGDVIAVKDFPAFAPWGAGEITAFWNLNVYTNQRQLAPAFAVILLFIYAVAKFRHLSAKRQVFRGIAWGIVFGVFPYFHQPSLLIIALLLICYFLLFPPQRLFIFVAGAVSAALIAPQLLLTPSEVKSVEWYPGFIIHNDILRQQVLPAVMHMLSFWWQNFGLHSILILVGFFVIPKKARNLLLPIVPLFLIPNLLRFSVEISANHKFFNFVLILGQMISAYVLMRLIRAAERHVRQTGLRIVPYVCVGCIIGLLTFSGVIDFFVVANDTKGSIADIPKNESAAWIARNTPPSAVFLNSSYLYHPASIAGRSIFLGWPYFAWSAGYRENRMPVMNDMYQTRDSAYRCRLLTKYHISYITVEDVRNDTNLPDIDLGYFLKTYTPVFTSRDRHYAIFSTASVCR